MRSDFQHICNFFGVNTVRVTDTFNHSVIELRKKYGDYYRTVNVELTFALIGILTGQSTEKEGETILLSKEEIFHKILRNLSWRVGR